MRGTLTKTLPEGAPAVAVRPRPSLDCFIPSLRIRARGVAGGLAVGQVSLEEMAR
jgi:hypothetical protein